ECHPDYSIFTMDVRPTFDFLQELLWNGECIEVMQPLWLRKEIAEKIQQMGNKYKSDNSPYRE
ncbi:MAG: WYL domain-containing protein, partial [Prevotella sp.]|nr:WYL domain-containing protein [Prevotella sp.]